MIDKEQIVKYFESIENEKFIYDDKPAKFSWSCNYNDNGGTIYYYNCTFTGGTRIGNYTGSHTIITAPDNEIDTLIKNAIEMGVEVVACSMSMDLMGIKKEELLAGVKFAGVATYLGATDDSGLNLFI